MRGIRVSDRDSGRTGRHDGFRVARRTVTAIAARDLVPRSSFDRRSIESRVPWRRRIPRWRPRRRPPGEEVHPRFLRSWDPWCVGCAGTVRAIGARRRQSLLRRETAKERTQIFWRNASRYERTDEVGTSRRLLSSRERSTLDARRSIACLPTRPVARPLPHARFTSSSPRAVPTSPPPRRAPHRSRRRAVRKSALASAAARRRRPAVPRRT